MNRDIGNGSPAVAQSVGDKSNDKVQFNKGYLFSLRGILRFFLIVIIFFIISKSFQNKNLK